MYRIPMYRIQTVVLLLVLLGACGFHLRGAGPSLDLGPVRVVGSGPESPLADRLARALARSGGRAPADGEPAATLRIGAESLIDRPLTVDANVEVREFVTVYTVKFEYLAADGKVLIPVQEAVIEREYVFNANDASGTPAERELIHEEVQRDMVGMVMRRVQAALEHRG